MQMRSNFNEPNVIPMIDVMLVLLIIFMMQVPLQRKAMDVQVPPEQELTRAQATALSNLRANQSWHVPLEFKVSLRTQREWVAVRAAWQNEKVAADDEEEEVDAACQALLGDCRAEADVAAAKVRLDTDGTAVQAAWNTACAE